MWEQLAIGSRGELRGLAWSQDTLGVLLQVESSQAFTWQSQLRHRWDEEKRHCFANICDAQIQYSYEYLGNTPRLVITPLTDRRGPGTLPSSPHTPWTPSPQFFPPSGLRLEEPTSG